MLFIILSKVRFVAVCIVCYPLIFNQERTDMAKSHDAKKNVKKEPTRTQAQKKLIKQEKKKNKGK